MQRGDQVLGDRQSTDALSDLLSGLQEVGVSALIVAVAHHQGGHRQPGDAAYVFDLWVGEQDLVWVRPDQVSEVNNQCGTG